MQKWITVHLLEACYRGSNCSEVALNTTVLSNALIVMKRTRQDFPCALADEEGPIA